MPRYQPGEPSTHGPHQVLDAAPSETLATGQGAGLAVEVPHVPHPHAPAPMALHEPAPDVVAQVLTLRSEGHTQEQIIESVWGIKKGGNAAYKRARDEYQFIIEAYGD